MTRKKDSKPDPPKWMPRKQPLSDERCRRFLYALMRLGNVQAAAKSAGANRTALYQRKARDEEFAAVWAECLQIGVSNLEDHAYDLAVNGWQEPVFHDGEECGAKQRYSPALIIFLLKSHDPKYKDRVELQHGSEGGGPLELNVIMDPAALAEFNAAREARADE